jgi:hypothetical protein
MLGAERPSRVRPPMLDRGPRPRAQPAEGQWARLCRSSLPLLRRLVCRLRLSMRTVAAMAAMHGHVQERTGEENQQRRIGEEMVSMPLQDQEASDRGKPDPDDEPLRRAPSGMHMIGHLNLHFQLPDARSRAAVRCVNVRIGMRRRLADLRPIL